MANLSSSKSVVWAAIAADVLIAAAKFAAAALTGGASIAAEGIHSIVDAASGGLMLYGYRQSSKGPDPQHPFGHGREVYFWSFIVSLLLFTLGAGLAVAQGATRILNPSEIRSPLLIFAVLFAELIFAGFSWRIAFKAFRKSKGELGYWEAIKSSKDPPGFIVLAQDTSSIIGVGIAAAGTFAASYLHAPLGDGIASVLIGILLGAVGLTLARESKGLLIGEGARKGLCASILKLAETQSGVEGANGAITAQLGPEQVVVALSLEFADEARSPDIERAVQQLEARVRKQHPEVVALYVKPQTPQTFKRMAPTG